MISSFTHLLSEAERDGYMLGSHSAREGEHVRGHASSSAYANLGFYKRDPRSDVAAGPTDKIPEEVWKTIQTIVNCFLEVHKIGESKKISSLLIPYIQDFEFFRKTIVQHGRVLEVLESRRKRLEKLLSDASDSPDDVDVATQVSKIEKVIADLEAEEVKLETQMTQQDADLESERPGILEDLITQFVALCKDKKDIGNTHQIEGAFKRYITLVYGRREDTRGGLTRSYLLLDPVISFMRFFNNASDTYKRRTERENDKITQITSAGKRGKNILKTNDKLKMLMFMSDCIANIVDLRKRGKVSPEEKTYADYIKKAYDVVQSVLDLNEKVQFQVLIDNFLTAKQGAEGELKRYLITDVKKKVDATHKEN